MTDHTPGPWKVDRAEDPMGDLGVLDQHGEWVATCLAVNANIIAAAPELKEAILAHLENRSLIWDAGLDGPTEIERQMLAALGKAVGRE